MTIKMSDGTVNLRVEGELFRDVEIRTVDRTVISFVWNATPGIVRIARVRDTHLVIDAHTEVAPTLYNLRAFGATGQYVEANTLGHEMVCDLRA